MSKQKLALEFKLGIAAVLLVVSGIIGMNCFTIVSVGSEASVESFGEVHEGKILQGFNFVAPWWGIDEFDLKHETNSFDDLEIASQDKFKTSLDVAYTGAFVAGEADRTRGETGNSSRFLHTHVTKRVQSCLTKAGGNVETSQAFFEKEVQSALASGTLACVNDYLSTVGGYKLSSIQFSDIRLDPVVKKFMVKTKERQEAENQQQSQLNIKDLEAQEVIKIANANLEAAEANKHSRMLAADAALYEKQLEAQGNTVLSKSVTPALVKYIQAGRWDGVLPTTSVGGDQGVLLSIK